ncbi:MAG TPA: immunoglobulin domain-containing protein, partial [Candidatus Dormibacteraeota bacterium]|nr:immunoglobulin domain-containing protein [Candidatus Dormibacteraeota bacterium]
MISKCWFPGSALVSLLCWLLLAAAVAPAQFIAFNDHSPGTNTAPNVTTWNIMGNSPGSAGALKDIDSGTTLGVTLTITRSGSVTAVGTAGNPNPGTPLYNTFNGYVDFLAATNTDSVVQVPAGSVVTYTFTGLNPAKVYSFKAGAVRGNPAYTDRWSLFELDGAVSFASAHTGGFTAGLATNQVAINTGINTNGEMVDWESIVPSVSGSIVVTSTQYTNSIPGGGTASGPYGYAITSLRLQEFIPTNMMPIAVTGFNRDLVVEKNATGPGYTNYALELNPAEGRAFYQKGLTGKSFGLPVSGGFVSVFGDNAVFQFQAFTSSNGLVLSSDTGVSTGTLTLTGPSIFQRIAVLANSASGGGAAPMVLNFADGSTFSTNFNAPDWFNNTGFALQGFERITLSTGATDGATTNPRFYQTSLDLAALFGATNKPLASITFSQSAGKSTAIYALSGVPATQFPPVVIASPSNTTVTELSQASFTSVVNGSPFPSLQWYRNNAPISGAINAAYSIPAVALADNNAQFKIVASNFVTGLSYSVTSSVANLTVIADTNPPVLLAGESFGLTQALVLFSERISNATATNTANYSLIGPGGAVAISAASLDGSQSNVILNVAGLTDGASYLLTVNNLRDLSAAANIIAPNSQTTFNASRFVPFAIGSPAPVGAQNGQTNGLDVTGGGSGTGGTNDQILAGLISQTGDFDFMARLGSLSTADAWSEAGLMAREDLTAGGR